MFFFITALLIKKLFLLSVITNGQISFAFPFKSSTAFSLFSFLPFQPHFEIYQTQLKRHLSLLHPPLWFNSVQRTVTSFLGWVLQTLFQFLKQTSFLLELTAAQSSVVRTTVMTFISLLLSLRSRSFSVSSHVFRAAIHCWRDIIAIFIPLFGFMSSKKGASEVKIGDAIKNQYISFIHYIHPSSGTLHTLVL